MQVAADRGQLGPAEVIAGDQIGEERLDVELLRLLQILQTVALAEVVLRSELIVVEVVKFLAREAVRLHVLVDDPGRYLQLGSGFPKGRNARAVAVASVDVLLVVRSDRIDEPAEVGAVADHPESGGRAKRSVDHALQPIAGASAIIIVYVSLDLALGRVELRLIGDVADGAAD